MHPRHHCTALALIAALALPALAGAQTTSGSTSPPANGSTSAATTTQADDPDKDVNFSQPDFNLAALPTTLRLPKFGSAFRVTHRFTRPLGDGDFASLLEDFFGLDSGAQIGLEYRFGIWKRDTARHPPHQRPHDRVLRPVRRAEREGRGGAGAGRAGHHRRHQQLQGQLLAGPRCHPVQGAGPARRALRRADLGEQQQPAAQRVADDNDTFMVGLGARLRVRPTVYGVVRVDAPGCRVLARRRPDFVRHREAGRRPPVPAELLERVRHDDRARSPAAATTTTTGISASTSRGSSTDAV